MKSIHKKAIPRGLLGGLVLVAAVAVLAVRTSAEAQEDPRLFFNTLQQRLVADGFNAERIRSLYQNDGVAFETRGVSLYFQHNEATLDYDKLTQRPWIEAGRHYMRHHIAALQRAEKEFGVDPHVITAIILVETKFGQYVGTRAIINTLSTMAALNESKPREYLWSRIPTDRRFKRDRFDQKADQKAQWAYNELKAFLTYAERHQIDAVNVKGSYAGALGLAQFMPSNILAYGRDGDGDGRIDLFGDTDAIVSIANYLRHYGWKPGIDKNKAYKVVHHYNHSKYYVQAVLKIAALLKG